MGLPVYCNSAVCVTGLVLHDTAQYWSYFGQFVIITLIQIGGMGSSNRIHCHCHAFRQKDRPDAEKYHVRGNSAHSCRRNW